MRGLKGKGSGRGGVKRGRGGRTAQPPFAGMHNVLQQHSKHPMPPFLSASQPLLLPLPFVTQLHVQLPVPPAASVLLPQQLLCQLPEPATPPARASAQPHGQPITTSQHMKKTPMPVGVIMGVFITMKVALSEQANTHSVAALSCCNTYICTAQTVS